MSIYIASDFHGDLTMLKRLCREFHTTRDDILLHVGDLQLNYQGYSLDLEKKKQVAELPITLCNIMGNHEMKPGLLSYYDLVEWMGGKAYKEEGFDNIIFAKDGEIYQLDDLSVIAIGGAYSPNKHYLVYSGYFWEPNEQLTEEEKQFVEKQLQSSNWTVDIVLSHTAPQKYVPREAFLAGFERYKIDDSMEKWLDTIEERVNYRNWYCGHFHIDKDIEKIHFMYNRISKIR